MQRGYGPLFEASARRLPFCAQAGSAHLRLARSSIARNCLVGNQPRNRYYIHCEIALFCFYRHFHTATFAACCDEDIAVTGWPTAEGGRGSATLTGSPTGWPTTWCAKSAQSAPAAGNTRRVSWPT